MREREHIPNYDEAVKRLYAAAGVRTQLELAAVLGIRQSSVSDAQRRRTLPADWLMTLLREMSVNPNWILFGDEPRLLPGRGGGKDGAGGRKAGSAEDAEGAAGTGSAGKHDRNRAAPPPSPVAEVSADPLHAYSAQELINELVRRALL